MAGINQSIEYDYPGDKVTGTASGAAILGKRLVRVLDNLGTTDGHRPVAYTAARGAAHYLARHDAVENADVSLVRKGAWTVTAGAAITAPALLMATAVGKVIPYAGPTAACVVGMALTDAAVDGDDVVVDLWLSTGGGAGGQMPSVITGWTTSTADVLRAALTNSSDAAAIAKTLSTLINDLKTAGYLSA